MKKIVRGTLGAILSLSIAFCTGCAKETLHDTIVVKNEQAAQAAQNTQVPSSVIAASPGSFERRVTLPSGMRAVFAAPGTDFSLDGSDLDKLCANISDLGMNAVIIETVKNGADYYDCELDGAEPDAVSLAVSAAHKANLGAYVTLDVNSLLKKISGSDVTALSAAVHKFVIKYKCEGVLLTDYYTADTPEAHEEYQASGASEEYSAWLYETNETVLRTVSEVVCKTSDTAAVGILAEDMWANSTSNPAGSQTADIVQALYDGHCDTKKYIENGYFDFVLVKAYGIVGDVNLDFKTVVSWWNDLGETNNVKTYVCHLNERVGARSGWNADQLLQQFAVMKELGANVGGSAFNSLSSLNANPLQSTDTMKKYFSDEIDLESTFEQLSMTSPAALNFATSDTTVKFAGTFDENFDVLLDGVKINSGGTSSFEITKDLKIGKNYFSVEHKGVKYNYTIERTIDVLNTVHSLGYITVDEGTTLSFTASAYSGADVYVSVGGEKIALAERGASEHVENGGTYSDYVGYYTVLGGEIGSVRYLGDITYSASYGGYSESTWGGYITIAALPEPPKEPDPVISEVVPDRTQLLGIDVSSYQGNIDFEAVKNGGYEFVIIKAGEWNHTVDGFYTYYYAAKEAGLHIGFYWFCDGDTIEEITLEAEACIEAVSGLQFDLPVFMDFENQYQFDEGREFCSEAVRTFCGKLKAAGYRTGLYASANWLDYVIDDDIKSDYTIWVADWRGYCGYYGDYGMWQYGAGEVPGIDVLTDLNIMELSNLKPI